MLRVALIALVLMAGLVSGGRAVAGPAENQMLALANGLRAQAGCPALRVDQRLTAAAAAHAQAMAQQNFFGHTGKDGTTAQRRIKAQGYRYREMAENIAAGYSSPDKTMGRWMASQGHRKNLLNCRFRDTGIALVIQPDDRPLAGQAYPLKSYWVQVFAQP